MNPLELVAKQIVETPRFFKVNVDTGAGFPSWIYISKDQVADITKMPAKIVIEVQKP